MTKESLVAMGLTEELAGKVMTELDGSFIPKSRFNEVIAEKNQLKEKVKERDDQLAELKTAAGTVDELKAKVAELQTANAEKEKVHAAEMRRIRRDAVDERLLSEAKAKNPLAVKPFLTAIDDNTDDMLYIEQRKIQIEALAKAESTQFLFAETEPPTGTPPGASGVKIPATPSGNPFDGKTYNEKQLLELWKSDPAAAKAMAKQAGLNIL